MHSLPPHSTQQDKYSKPGRTGSVSLQQLLPTYSTGTSCSPCNKGYQHYSLLPCSLHQLTQHCLSEFPNCFLFPPRDLSLLHYARSSATPFSESSYHLWAFWRQYGRLNPALSSSNLFSSFCHHLQAEHQCSVFERHKLVGQNKGWNNARVKCSSWGFFKGVDISKNNYSSTILWHRCKKT